MKEWFIFCIETMEPITVEQMKELYESDTLGYMGEYESLEDFIKCADLKENGTCIVESNWKRFVHRMEKHGLINYIWEV